MKVFNFFIPLVLFCIVNMTSLQAVFSQTSSIPPNIECGEDKIIRGVKLKSIEFCGTKEEAQAYQEFMKVFLFGYYSIFKTELYSMFKCKKEDCANENPVCKKDVHIFKISVTNPYPLGNGCYKLEIKPHIRAICKECQDAEVPIDPDPKELNCESSGNFEQELGSMNISGTAAQINQRISDIRELLYEYYNSFPEDLNGSVKCKNECREGEECYSNVSLGEIGYSIEEDADGGSNVTFLGEIEAECSCDAFRGAVDNQVRNIKSSEDILIHPNPSNGVFTLDLKNIGDLEGGKIEIFNLQGQIMHTQALYNNTPKELQINMSERPKGIYFIFLKSKNSRNIIKKLIVE